MIEAGIGAYRKLDLRSTRPNESSRMFGRRWSWRVNCRRLPILQVFDQSRYLIGGGPKLVNRHKDAFWRDLFAAGNKIGCIFRPRSARKLDVPFIRRMAAIAYCEMMKPYPVGEQMPLGSK
jgi:hypothetical protein